MAAVFYQNKSSVLQSEQGKLNKYGTMVLSVWPFSGSCLVCTLELAILGVSILIIQMYILNAVISPKKYIDYEKLMKAESALR